MRIELKLNSFKKKVKKDNKKWVIKQKKIDSLGIMFKKNLIA